MKIVPVFQKAANKFVVQYHDHHEEVVGSIFQIGCEVDGELVGVAICGRPVARETNYKEVIEVSRLCVKRAELTDRSIKNVCSKLYSSCARIAKEMGYLKIQTFTLMSEHGNSLKASGWELEVEETGGVWSSTKNRIRSNKVVTLFETRIKYPDEPKSRWAKILNQSS